MKRILASLVFVLFMATPGLAAAQPNPSLSALDAELIIKIRQAGLWEMPAGEIAQERSANPKIQEVGRTLMTDDAQLDIEVRRVAALYNLALPAEPDDQQKGWLAELATASGSQFDSVWAMRLRAAHGMIFPVISKARAATPDAEIRKFATTANAIVIKHMASLEGTGAVDFNALEDTTPLVLKSDADGIDMVVALTLVPLVVAITIFSLWMAAGRNRRRGDAPAQVQEPEQDERPRGGRRRREDSRSTKLFADKEYAR